MRIREGDPVDGGDSTFVPDDVEPHQACLGACREVHGEGGVIVIGGDGRPAVAVGEDSGREGFGVEETVGAGDKLVGIFKV